MDVLPVDGGDPLTDLLNGIRTTGAIFNRSTLQGEWAIRFEDGSPLALAVLLEGAAWITADGSGAVRLGPGDVCVLSGGTPYEIAGVPGAKPDVILRPGGRCTTATLDEMSLTAAAADLRAERQHRALLINGLYAVRGNVPARLLAALPPVAVVEAGERACPVGPAVLEQITDTQPGQQVLLDRTLDLMLITALRAWFTRPDGPVWYRTYTDPVTGHALRLLNANPAHPWTVATLATTAGVSRAALAKRFTNLLGQPPMTYLREHRLAIAADLLRDPDVTLDVVARHVGFSTAFALSAAFKKAHGISPSRYRTELAADARQP